MTNTPMTSREAFEAWAKAYYQEQQMTRHPESHYATPDQYILPHYESAWEAWQACEQQNQAVIAELRQQLAERDAVIAKKDEALEFAEIKLLNRDFKSDVISNALAIQPSSNVLENFDIEALQDSIKKLLVGIDKDECEDSSGWWETSTGAAFGTGVLATLLQMISDCAPLYRLKDK